MLRLFQPCLPTRVYKAPVGAHWVSEIKLDGFRIVARKVGRRVILQSKQGYDYAERYPLIVDALMRMRASSIVLDGGAMCGDSFDDLWNRANDEHVRLCAFDLLELDGEDYRERPLLDERSGSPSSSSATARVWSLSST